MSKVIKQMEMTSLKNTFQDVRDMVFLTMKGLSCLGDATLRTALRKKKIRLKIVKNTLARKVFDELGLHLNPQSPYWQGPSIVAWGTSSIAELSQELKKELEAPKTLALFKDKVTIKGAVADGEEVTFDVALKMPTRAQAIAEVIGTIIGAGAAVVGCLTAAGNQIASQISQIADRKEEAPAETPASETPAATAS
jgi:large subunit ribosomal protein L10